MSLFKSKAERKIERDIQVRQGISQIRRQIKNLEQNEKEWIEKARRAKRLGSDSQLALIKRTIRQTISQRMMMDRQLLAIETASQMKSQAESHASFAKAMAAVSTAIGEVFGTVDLTRTQKNFEMAIAKAESMEERMNILLDMTEGSMSAGAEGVDEGIILDEEIDRLIDSESEGGGRRRLSPEIEKELAEIERELK